MVDIAIDTIFGLKRGNPVRDGIHQFRELRNGYRCDVGHASRPWGLTLPSVLMIELQD